MNTKHFGQTRTYGNVVVPTYRRHEVARTLTAKPPTPKVNPMRTVSFENVGFTRHIDDGKRQLHFDQIDGSTWSSDPPAGDASRAPASNSPPTRSPARPHTPAKKVTVVLESATVTNEQPKIQTTPKKVASIASKSKTARTTFFYETIDNYAALESEVKVQVQMTEECLNQLQNRSEEVVDTVAHSGGGENGDGGLCTPVPSEEQVTRNLCPGPSDSHVQHTEPKEEDTEEDIIGKKESDQNERTGVEESVPTNSVEALEVLRNESVDVGTPQPWKGCTPSSTVPSSPRMIEGATTETEKEKEKDAVMQSPKAIEKPHRPVPASRKEGPEDAGWDPKDDAVSLTADTGATADGVTANTRAIPVLNTAHVGEDLLATGLGTPVTEEKGGDGAQPLAHSDTETSAAAAAGQKEEEEEVHPSRDEDLSSSSSDSDHASKSSNVILAQYRLETSDFLEEAASELSWLKESLEESSTRGFEQEASLALGPSRRRYRKSAAREDPLKWQYHLDDGSAPGRSPTDQQQGSPLDNSREFSPQKRPQSAYGYFSPSPSPQSSVQWNPHLLRKMSDRRKRAETVAEEMKKKLTAHAVRSSFGMSCLEDEVDQWENRYHSNDSRKSGSPPRNRVDSVDGGELSDSGRERGATMTGLYEALSHAGDMSRAPVFTQGPVSLKEQQQPESVRTFTGTPSPRLSEVGSPQMGMSPTAGLAPSPLNSPKGRPLDRPRSPEARRRLFGDGSDASPTKASGKRRPKSAKLQTLPSRGDGASTNGHETTSKLSAHQQRRTQSAKGGIGIRPSSASPALPPMTGEGGNAAVVDSNSTNSGHRGRSSRNRATATYEGLEEEFDRQLAEAESRWRWREERKALARRGSGRKVAAKDEELVVVAKEAQAEVATEGTISTPVRPISAGPTRLERSGSFGHGSAALPSACPQARPVSAAPDGGGGGGGSAVTVEFCESVSSTFHDGIVNGVDSAEDKKLLPTNKTARARSAGLTRSEKKKLFRENLERRKARTTVYVGAAPKFPNRYASSPDRPSSATRKLKLSGRVPLNLSAERTSSITPIPTAGGSKPPVGVSRANAQSANGVDGTESLVQRGEGGEWSRESKIRQIRSSGLTRTSQWLQTHRNKRAAPLPVGVQPHVMDEGASIGMSGLGSSSTLPFKGNQRVYELRSKWANMMGIKLDGGPQAESFEKHEGDDPDIELTRSFVSLSGEVALVT